MTFPEYADHQISDALRTILPAEATDIYAVSLFVYDVDDDPRTPTATVGYNTEAAVTAAIGDASDEAEARWNYAFWLQNTLRVVADPEQDPDGKALCEAWIADLGFAYTDEDEEADFDAAMEKGSGITAAFVEVLVATVQRLHAGAVLTEIFGRPIPVLIHELEYYDEIVGQNRRANPGGLVDGLAEWVDSA